MPLSHLTRCNAAPLRHIPIRPAGIDFNFYLNLSCSDAEDTSESMKTGLQAIGASKTGPRRWEQGVARVGGKEHMATHAYRNLHATDLIRAHRPISAAVCTTKA